MYVFSLVLCLWDAPNRSGKNKEKQRHAFFFFIPSSPFVAVAASSSVCIPLFPCCLRLLSASESRPLVILALLLLLSGRTG